MEPFFLFSSREEPSIRKVKAFYILQKVRHSSGTFRDTMSYNSSCSLSICKITDFLRCVLLPAPALQFLQLTLIRASSYDFDNLVSTAVPALLLDDDAEGAGFVALSVYKHGAKILRGTQNTAEQSVILLIFKDFQKSGGRSVENRCQDKYLQPWSKPQPYGHTSSITNL